ncbi:low temperature requirement protein A [Glaciihabitans sp. INWT7]|uniref:low temperature requirement protein A n=1 Tax=Glaciihabitans sp. INWT7 TaxID=2596912 RepID=UPI0016246CB5|nr:low temperature requirement protein A [Glaciihabitans sp. INWT7]QNE47496.1 low temperature requirement protein A [Glaciihabitans sp. INWT7]
MSLTPTAVHPGRRVHWLELFFDLVMVVYIGQIAQVMHGDPGWLNAAVFVAFLGAAWWAWVNATVTMNLFGARITRSTWAAVTIAMIAIGVMAAAVPEALGDRAAAFAVGNAVIRLVWVQPWFSKRRTIGVPWWRPVLYSVVPASLWVVSIWVAPPWQYALWAVAVAIEIALLSFLSGQQAWLRTALDIDHLVERVGLLVVIVFGESILTIISELDGHWTVVSGLAAVLGFASVSLLAWIYFGHATSAVERGLRALLQRGSITGLRDTVMYLPFLLVAGITLFATALGTAVAEAGHPLPAGAVVSLSAGISLFFLASTAESLRYGAPWRQVVLWGPAGILLPWGLAPLSNVIPAEGVVACSTAVIAIVLALTEINVWRLRALPERTKGAALPPMKSPSRVKSDLSMDVGLINEKSPGEPGL